MGQVDSATVTIPTSPTSGLGSTPTTPATNRPSWLPEKFSSPEQMAASYVELEKRLGSAPAAPTTPTTPATPTAPVIPTQPANPNGAFAQYEQEIVNTGTLSEASLQALEKQGITRDLAQLTIAGVEARRQSRVNEVFSAVGGEENFKQAVNWASTNLNKAEIDAINRALNGPDAATARLAAEGLAARYRAAAGVDPSLTFGHNASVGAQPYESEQQWMTDVMNPLYSSDPAFRQKVEKRLAASMAVKN